MSGTVWPFSRIFLKAIPIIPSGGRLSISFKNIGVNVYVRAGLLQVFVGLATRIATTVHHWMARPALCRVFAAKLHRTRGQTQQPFRNPPPFLGEPAELEGEPGFTPLKPSRQGIQQS